MNPTKISKARRHERNPFIERGDSDKVISSKGTYAKVIGRKLIDTSTGDEVAMFAKEEKLYDKDKFVKIFTSNVGLIFGLTRTAQTVLSKVIECLKVDEDKFYINLVHIQKECGYKAATPIYRGLTELIDKGIIARTTDRNLWYINPHVLFNGNRITLMRNIVLKDVKQLESED